MAMATATGLRCIGLIRRATAERHLEAVAAVDHARLVGLGRWVRPAHEYGKEWKRSPSGETNSFVVLLFHLLCVKWNNVRARKLFHPTVAMLCLVKVMPDYLLELL